MESLSRQGDSDDVVPVHNVQSVDHGEGRAAFLAGEGTLTVDEVWAWAEELGWPHGRPANQLRGEIPLSDRVLKPRGCCAYAASDGSTALKRLVERGVLVQHRPRGPYFAVLND